MHKVIKTYYIMTDKFLIICANVNHPDGKPKFFLLTDMKGNTAEFEEYEEAENWKKHHPVDGLLYCIITTSDFIFSP